MKQSLLPFAVIVLLMGVLFTQTGKCNPYQFYETVPPPAGSIPLKITVLSPQNNTVQIGSNIVNVTLNISTKDTSMTALLDAYLKADWLKDNTTIYKQNTYSPEFPQSWNFTTTFENVPDGEHKIVIYALGDGSYATNNGGLTANMFSMTSTSTVVFTTDSIPPKISIISPANISYSQSNIQLTFTSDKPSAASYSLDGKQNITLTGDRNTTINNIPNGLHNVTVYVSDSFGYVGSQTVTFTINTSEPFPTLGLAAGLATVAVVSIAIVLFVRRQRTKTHFLAA
jgi:hypothetical protein